MIGSGHAQGVRPGSNFRPRSSAPDLSIDAIDAVPCGRAARWLGLIRRMSVRAVIDRLLPIESELSHGVVIEGLMLSRLLDPHPLSGVEDWMRVSGVDVLLGLDAAKFNDDRIGRTLDALCDTVRDAQPTYNFAPSDTCLTFLAARSDAYWGNVTDAGSVSARRVYVGGVAGGIIVPYGTQRLLLLAGAGQPIRLVRVTVWGGVWSRRWMSPPRAGVSSAPRATRPVGSVCLSC